MKKLAALLLSGGLLAGVMIAPTLAAPVTVWEDASGDADAGQGAGSSIPAGLDLTAGSIEKKGKDLVFTVTLADMPPSGSLPEGARFLWAFAVGAKSYRWTFKSADIGKPDVLGGQTTERVGRVDAQGHFRLEADCASQATGPLNAVNCVPVGYYTGTIDPASTSFTMVVPLADIKAKRGTVIAGGGGNEAGICQICWVSHLAERSSSATIIDSASQTGTYKIPKK